MKKLRDILVPSASKERIEIVKSKIKEIENRIDEGKDVSVLIDEFNIYTGRLYDKEYFMTYWNSESIEDFARDAAQPKAIKVNDILKEELIEVVDRIRRADENTKFYLEVLEANLPHPRISNLIFWPEVEGLTDNSTSEEIVNKALEYRPIQL